MITNVDARVNAQTSYDHAIIKYCLHDLDPDTGRVTSPPVLSLMAQTHKKSKVGRFLQDYMGMVLIAY